MGVPTISERKHYRLVPGEPEEPTSTIVLTSKDSHFVDIRILREQYEKEKAEGTYTLSSIDWAFAGRAHVTPQGARKDGKIQLSHTVWDHWIDSKCDNPEADEGDMWVQRDGDVLEKGKNKDPVSGEEIEYEELWRDLEVQSLGKKHNRHGIVMKVDEPDRGVRGMAIKIGGWCQGILKAGDELTVERWQRKGAESATSKDLTFENDSNDPIRNDWAMSFKVGAAQLPCEDMCTRTMGKFGLNSVRLRQVDSDWQSEVLWRVLEEYYW